MSRLAAQLADIEERKNLLDDERKLAITEAERTFEHLGEGMWVTDRYIPVMADGVHYGYRYFTQRPAALAHVKSTGKYYGSNLYLWDNRDGVVLDGDGNTVLSDAPKHPMYSRVAR